MYAGEAIRIFGWERVQIYFTENNGMAFGFEIVGESGKLILSIFRILAVGGIGWYLWYIIKKKYATGLIFSIALILGGALGNIIDSCFYGMIFSSSDPWERNVAELFPPEGGYAGFLHGKVVDMFYFPLFNGTFPEWFPVWGGEEFEFFRPVFNVSDAAISTGVLSILIFQRRLFPKKAEEATESKEPGEENSTASDEPKNPS